MAPRVVPQPGDPTPEERAAHEVPHMTPATWSEAYLWEVPGCRHPVIRSVEAGTGRFLDKCFAAWISGFRQGPFPWQVL